MIWTTDDGLYTSGWFHIHRVTRGYEAWYKSEHEIKCLGRVPSLRAAKDICELRAKNDKARWESIGDRGGPQEGRDYRLRDRTALRSTDLLPSHEALADSRVQTHRKTQ
jgi:hypothetical protein